MRRALWSVWCLLPGCSLFQPPVEAHEVLVRYSPKTVDLPLVTYETRPQFRSFLIENLNADTLYVSTDPPTGDGADLVVIGLEPHTTLAPDQRDLIEVSLDPRTWRWRSGTFTPTMRLEAGYFFSGQDVDEPETPSTTEAPSFERAVYDLFVSFTIDCDIDDDGYDAVECSGPDCDDRLAAVHPDAEERCDGFDGDCDGAIDESAIDETIWYYDADRDGYGDPEIARSDCNRPAQNWVEDGTDCDDEELVVRPGAAEICDRVDNNCDGRVDEGCHQ
ncbi:MAG TPA: putative metal-binding motif-containing protein [Myxococcota bacterium]|nr:putative metal-binding motif-containing protein [Myxococcota bacterium]